MKVNDLFLIVRELKQIIILQANLLATIKLIDDKHSVYREQLQAFENLQKIVEEYEQFDL